VVALVVSRCFSLALSQQVLWWRSPQGRARSCCPCRWWSFRPLGAGVPCEVGLLCRSSHRWGASWVGVWSGCSVWPVQVVVSVHPRCACYPAAPPDSLVLLLRSLCPVFPHSQSSMSVQVHASRRPRIAAAPHWLWSVPVGWAPSTPTGWVSEGVCSILPMCSRHSLFLFDLGCGCGLLSVQVPSSYGGCHR